MSPMFRKPTRRGAGAQAAVERRLIADAGRARVEPSPQLRSRTMRALHDARFDAAATPTRRLPLVVGALTVAAIAVAVLTLTLPGVVARNASPQGPDVAAGPDSPAPNPAQAFTRMERASEAALRTTFGSPLSDEADALLEDGRRITRLAMNALPRRLQPDAFLN